MYLYRPKKIFEVSSPWTIDNLGLFKACLNKIVDNENDEQINNLVKLNSLTEKMQLWQTKNVKVQYLRILYSCRGRGIRSNGTPRTPALGQLKEHTGCLVSRSLALPAAPPDEPQAFDDFPCTKKKDIIVFKTEFNQNLSTIE